MEQKSVRDRLSDYLKYKGVNKSEFGRMIGVSSAYITSIRNSIQPDKLLAIRRAFPDLNTEWLLLGVGDMVGGETSPPPKISDDTPPNTIRYYPEVDGTLGGVEFLSNPNEKFETITIPGYTDCTIAINAYGNSMQPTIKSGQVLLLSEWQESFIEWGKIYLVVTNNGYRCVKYLFPSDDESEVICRSEDTASYPDFKVHRNDIFRMYLVKGWICRDAM